MNEEVTGVSEEIEVDLFADEAEPTAPKESPTEETKAEEATEEASDSVEPEADVTEEATPEAESEDPKPRTAEARKEALNNEIRELVAKRNEARAEIERLNAQFYQPQTAEELMEQGEDPAIARVTALEQRQQMAEYNAQVTDLNTNLSVESLQVLNDFPMFNPDAPEYDAALATRAAAYYQKVAGLQTDPQTGLVIAANASPYETYKLLAETYQASQQNGKINGQRAAERMLANTDTPASAAPKTPKVDPLTALWNE